MDVSSAIEDLVGSRKGALNMIIVIASSGNLVTREVCNRNRISDPIWKYYFSRDWLRTVVCVKLDVEVISFHKCIDSKTLHARIYISLCSYHKWNLTGLEIKVNRRIGYNCCNCWISSTVYVSTIFGIYVPIKIALWNTIYGENRNRNRRRNFNNYFSVC